jgi:putative copper export protein/mono/diheme cytochrome c family protein/peroxiredoxin
MTALGLTARWVHLASCLALVGGAAILLLAGRSDRPTVHAWQARILGWSRAFALLAILSGLAALGWQTALLEGRAAAALDVDAVRRVALDTQGGRVTVVRQGLLVLLFAFLWLRPELRSRADWTAARGEAALLAALAAALLGLVGHAAAVEPDTARAVVNDAVHILAAGIWVGGLWPLALLLRRASAIEGADARPYAVLAARRFSSWALGATVVLAGTGLANAYFYVGDVAGLLGTSYGHLLLTKLGMLVPILVVAGLNRRTLPALAGEAERVGRPAMRRLARFVTLEGALAFAMLVVVAAMIGTPPARHASPTWPLTFRLSTAVLADALALHARVLVGSQIAVLGAVAALCSLAWRRRRAPLAAAALGLITFGLGLALPPLAIDAYPITYRRPAVPYTASSIATGSVLYAQNCAACHGPLGAGDGLAGFPLPRPPADLRAPHTRHHTAGDLYWWIADGIPAGGMPGFADRLTEDERWDLVNFVRALAAARDARRLGPQVEREPPRIVAPDATFAVGPTPVRSLREYRGRKLVLLVLYTLPASRARLAELAELYPQLVVLGVEVVAVPRDADPEAIRRLGDQPPIWFPVVTEGAADIATTYSLFSQEPHAEFLIDRQGYLRAISSGDRAWRAPETLLAAARQLNEERSRASEPSEHVH